MSDAANKSPLLNAIALAKSLRDDLKKNEADKPFSVREAVKAIAGGVREAIAEHQAELVKMRSLELAALKKNDKILTVFDLVKAAAVDGEDVIDLKNANDPEKRLKNGNGPDTVVPSDKPMKQTEQGEGSGGQVTDKSVFAFIKGKSDVKKEEMEKYISPAIKYGPTKPAPASPPVTKEELDKAGPKLGGKDPGSQMMTQHAFANAPKAPQAPAAPKPKQPTMAEHSERAATFADFMPPAGGKFGKTEYEGEHCPYCKKSMGLCKCE